MPHHEAHPRRIPRTEENRKEVVQIAELAHNEAHVVKRSQLAPTGVLLTLRRSDETGRVVALLEAAGYTVRAVAVGVVAVTGVISHLEILRAERARLDAAIEAEERREAESAAAEAAA